MFSKGDYENEMAESPGAQSPTADRKESRKGKGISTTNDGAMDNQVPEHATKEDKIVSGSVPEFLKNLLSAKTMLTGADLSKKETDSMQTVLPYRPGISVADKLGQRISSFIPPSFSMLQEQAQEITRHPILTTPKRKVTVTRVYTSQGSKPKTPPEPTSLFEKFKQKSQESFLTEKSFSYKGPFTPSRGQSSPSLPSHVGVEDISKSPVDLKDEQLNRKLWDRMREKANREEEEKNKLNTK